MVSALPYALDSTLRINWNATQEKSLSTDFPLDLELETDDQFVVRTYLQFLWLPESIMPLKLLVPSLLRVTSEPTVPHALHAYLKPLLHRAGSASRKYNVELPQILAHGGGAGEIEETMMWYALNHALADDEVSARISEGPWEDEKWRQDWIERMERREYQIQILLYFLKLSLPGPMPPPSPPPKRGKRKRSQQVSAEPPPEVCLETFMDKLAGWQLLGSHQTAAETLHASSKDKPLDWMQSFFEEIVIPQFGTQLPELCAIMRSKIFPEAPSLSSNPASPSSSRATSPDIPNPHKRGTSIPRRDPSPALSVTSSKAQALVRNRSRSLSVSLAQERIERERERSVTAGPSKKRVLNREVSMSRAFKPKPKPKPSKAEARKRAGSEPQTQPEAEAEARKKKDEGVTLVEATPTKPRIAPGRTQSQSQFHSQSGSQSQSQSQSLFGAGHASRARSFVIQSSLRLGAEDEDEEEEEEEWRLPGSSSPDILLLAPGRLVNGDDTRAARALADSTPTKRSRLR
ncbi:putative DNA replication regulator SLD3 [Lyophyllum shimeji]|uniref:DNA replication regulator SLD3 n=1 Tax=Lyophyllum shimeji TaxID=47721 RepID=A0A9P3UR29_LYOSH|nr:putative DNA replication regulator SLD3 [Lyophyllum shimeji]